MKWKHKLGNLNHLRPWITTIIAILILISTLLSTTLWYSHALLIELGFTDTSVSLFQDPFQDLLIRVGIVSVIGISIAVFLFTLDRAALLKTLNNKIKESLSERKLEDNFDHLYSGQSTADILKNVQALLTLYKSFDNMKSTRVATEVSTLKTVFDHIDTGLLLINREKIVTLINHSAEQSLGLIPGEIIGQTVSRKISNHNLLQYIDSALGQDQKTREKSIKINEKTDITVNAFPIKNRLGEVVRALVIITPEKKKRIKKDPA